MNPLANRTVVIGSRGSDLALWQAHHVQSQLKELGISTRIEIIKTQGDIIQHLSFDKMEGKGFFTKEIEAALLDKSIDLAVHSHKDLETTSPPGLVVAAVSERENPAELLLMHPHAYDPLKPLHLREGAVVGTSAARRKGQLKMWRSDLQIKDLRGNVPTRIQKLQRGDYDAILLARAGMTRLELKPEEIIIEELDPRWFVPAPAQGVLALQVREDDRDLFQALQALNSEEVAADIGRERGVLKQLQGGCQVPFGALCSAQNGSMQYWAFLANRSGEAPRRVYFTGNPTDFSAEKMLAKLQNPRNKCVLVTRTMRPGGTALRMLEESGCEVTQQSFINIKPLPLDAPDWQKVDWLFFTSANAVEHFEYLSTKPESVRVAVIGKGTMQRLADLGIEADFVGLGSTADVAEVFREELGEGHALVVCASNGMRTVQRALQPERFTEIHAYQTEEAPVSVKESFDVIAFTSPSNVRAFFTSAELGTNTQCVAIGRATAREIESRGYSCTVAWETTEEALADTILGLD